MEIIVTEREQGVKANGYDTQWKCPKEMWGYSGRIDYIGDLQSLFQHSMRVLLWPDGSGYDT